MSQSRTLHETLFFIMRITLEWLFVLNLVTDVKLEMHAQVQQVLVHYFKRVVKLVENEDGGFGYYKYDLPPSKRKRESEENRVPNIVGHGSKISWNC